MRLFTRSIRPVPDNDDPIVPNANDPASVPPSTVGPDQLVVPGDPNMVTVTGESGSWVPPSIVPSAWSGWPADWGTSWANDPTVSCLTDVAWMCIDYNSSLLATMPPYLVNAVPSLQATWLANPDPGLSWSRDELCKQLYVSCQAVG